MRIVYVLLMCAVLVFTGCDDVIVEPGNDKLVDLSINWKFQIGDDSAWSQIDFDDSKWDKITVPSSWENQGFMVTTDMPGTRISFEGSTAR
ncbi:MAG: hypothetical protein IPG53_06595 [Ignavibacteriales bacterium]|nr:hypothetical protein [Ignavibacteriales bacterium]